MAFIKSHLRAALLCSPALVLGSAALAQPAPREPVDPPKIDGEASEAVTLMALPVQPGTARQERVLDLAVTYTESKLYNPATGKYDRVHLRSYQGPDMDPDAPYVSPTIEIAPGETIRMNLDNQLPADPSCGGDNHDMNTPHCFNGTNLHTHGLWINPSGNGDNVLLSINPGVKFEYEYNVPPDHPSGTFWYHTHRHGSTALQVSSGMAGALIIRGDRKPTADANGDIDILMGDVKERVLVFQQIQYACRTKPVPGYPHGTIKEDADGRYICDEGDVGVIEDYDQFGPGTWPASGRYTSVNGQVLPTFKAKQGQVERWRMIHAGVRDTISLQFFRAKPRSLRSGAPLLKTAEAVDDLIERNCTGEAIPYQLMAADGLTMVQGAQTDLATLQPGYRWDALVVFPDVVDDDGIDYCVVDSAAPKSGSVPDGASGRQLVGFVQVEPGEQVGDVRQRVTDVLVAAAEQSAMDPAVKSAVVTDLNDGLKFTRFIPHPDIAAEEVTGKQELTFFIDTSTSDVKFEVGNTLQTEDVRPYDPDRIDRNLVLGEVDEWVMQSHFVSHPFHIHVNPFQIVSIIDPTGKDVTAPGAIDNGGGTTTVDPQYAGLKGVWKDTLWIKSLLPSSTLAYGNSGIYTINVRTRYQRYIGEFVLHCHILDHEDQGMMQNVAVVLPTGNVGSGSTLHTGTGGETSH